MARRPKGYTGLNHETIGSDILAVLKILKLPEQVLTPEDARRVKLVRADSWYPISWLMDLMDTLERDVGPYGLMRMGRVLFSMSHEERVLRVARSARDIIHGLDAMYHHANRGNGIGGWRVLRFEPGYAEVEKTTPHHCIMEQGILTAALAAVHCPVTVAQSVCFRQGAESCVFTITSSITDERWNGPAQADAPPAARRKLGETDAPPAARPSSRGETDFPPATRRTPLDLELPPPSRRPSLQSAISPATSRPVFDLEIPPPSRRRM
jgi:hypothetical protein